MVFIKKEHTLPLATIVFIAINPGRAEFYFSKQKSILTFLQFLHIQMAKVNQIYFV